MILLTGFKLTLQNISLQFCFLNNSLLIKVEVLHLFL